MDGHRGASRTDPVSAAGPSGRLTLSYATPRMPRSFLPMLLALLWQSCRVPRRQPASCWPAPARCYWCCAGGDRCRERALPAVEERRGSADSETMPVSIRGRTRRYLWRSGMAYGPHQPDCSESLAGVGDSDSTCGGAWMMSTQAPDRARDRPQHILELRRPVAALDF